MSFEGKVVVITGAAGGLGVHMSRHFAEQGAAIAVVDIDGARAEAAAQVLRETGARALAVAADITAEPQVAAMAEAIAEGLGGADVLINNATISDPEMRRIDSIGLENLTPEVWDAYMAVNGRGAMLCCKHLIPQMVARGGGSVVNIASVAGLKGGHALLAYGASKAAMMSLTRHVAVAYGKQNIRCNAVAPGAIVHDGLRARASEAVFDTSTVLTSRLGDPEDLVQAVAYLASDASGFITGQVLAVDGGGVVGKLSQPKL